MFKFILTHILCQIYKCTQIAEYNWKKGQRIVTRLYSHTPRWLSMPFLLLLNLHLLFSILIETTSFLVRKIQSVKENFHSFYHYFLSYLYFSLYTLILLFHRWIGCVLNKDQTLHSRTIFLPPPHTSEHYGSSSFLLLHHLMCPFLVSSYLFPFSVEPSLTKAFIPMLPLKLLLVNYQSPPHYKFQ